MGHISAAPQSISAAPTGALRTVSLVALGSALVAACAHVAVPLGFTPVPVTLQTFAVVLLGLVLGPGAAFTTLSLYLFEGLAGLPVFTPHGPGGILQIIGPTGGYLLSYPLAALCTSLLYRALPRRDFASAVLAGATGSIITLTIGASWLSSVMHQPFHSLLTLSVLPFLPGDALKVAAAAGVVAAIRSLQTRAA